MARAGLKAQNATLSDLKTSLEGKLAKFDRELRRAKAGAAGDGEQPSVADLHRRLIELEMLVKGASATGDPPRADGS